MKRIIAALLSVLTIASVCTLSLSAATESGELHASVVSFDNSDTSKIALSGATLEYIKTTTPGVDMDEHRDYYDYYAKITGEGCYSFTVDASDIDFSESKVSAVVIDAEADLSALSVSLTEKGTENSISAAYTEYNGTAYFLLSSACDAKSVTVTTLTEGMQINLTEVFFCKNEYSAKFMVDNNVLPSTAEKKQLIITEQGNYTAIDIKTLQGDDKDVSKGGMYYDFYNSKWPSITVDENDKLYVIASGTRKEHTDPFSSTVLVTSTDGGKTYSKPRQINNSINDDRDTGITYLGGGKLIASYLNDGGADYLPETGGFYYHLMRHYSSESDADSWVNGCPVGGINGTYVDILSYIARTDPSYSIKDASYVLMSDDYGETWNSRPYTLKGTVGEDGLTEKMVETAYNYQLTYDGISAPIRSPHGPRQLSDGTLLWVGESVDTTQVPWNNKAVYTSTDGGYTWNLKCKLPIPCDFHNGDFQEADLCETKDGVIVCALRSFNVFTTFSYDKGQTWTTPTNTHATEDNEPLIGISHGITTMKNGDILLTTAHRTDGSTPMAIYAYVSEDGGRTWSRHDAFSRSFTSNDDMGYPGNAELSDGTIVTCYYGNSTIMTTNWTYETVVAKPNTWVKTGHGWVYFDENNEMVTKKWVKDSVGWCYLGADGYAVCGTTVKDTKGFALLDNSGHWLTKTGWQKAGGNWFYVQKSGYVKTKCWMKDSTGWCYLSDKGIMQKNKVIKDTKGYCLLDASGYWVTRQGWNKVGGDWYYVEKGGYLKTSTWMKDSKGWCYLASDGMMQHDTVIEDKNGLCFLNSSGYWVTKQGWQKSGTSWYYVQKGGYLKTNGWMKDSTGWCYLDKYGNMLRSTVIKDTNGYCYINDSGYWLTSTKEDLWITRSLDGKLAAGYYTINKNGYLVAKK